MHGANGHYTLPAVHGPPSRPINTAREHGECEQTIRIDGRATAAAVLAKSIKDICPAPARAPDVCDEHVCLYVCPQALS